MRKSTLRTVIMSFILGSVFCLKSLAQQDSLTRIDIDNFFDKGPRRGWSNVSQSRIIIDDLTLGVAVLTFSTKNGELQSKSRTPLLTMITTNMDRIGTDSTKYRLRLALLPEHEIDRRDRINRIAAIANYLKSNGIDCERIEVSCIENTSEISYYQNVSTQSFRPRKRTMLVVLTHIALGNRDRDEIDRRCSLIARLCDFYDE